MSIHPKVQEEMARDHIAFLRKAAKQLRGRADSCSKWAERYEELADSQEERLNKGSKLP